VASVRLFEQQYRFEFPKYVLVCQDGSSVEEAVRPSSVVSNGGRRRSLRSKTKMNAQEYADELLMIRMEYVVVSG